MEVSLGTEQLSAVQGYRSGSLAKLPPGCRGSGWGSYHRSVDLLSSNHFIHCNYSDRGLAFHRTLVFTDSTACAQPFLYIWAKLTWARLSQFYGTIVSRASIQAYHASLIASPRQTPCTVYDCKANLNCLLSFRRNSCDRAGGTSFTTGGTFRQTWADPRHKPRRENGIEPLGRDQG